MSVLPQVSMPFVRLLYQFWLMQGVPKQLLDEILRIDISDETSVKFGISSRQLAQLHKAAVEHTQDLSLGIKLGQFIAQQEMDMTKLLLSAESLQQAIQILLDYSQVISESGYFSLNAISAENYELQFITKKDVDFSCHQQNMVFSAVIAWLQQLVPGIQDSITYRYQKGATDDRHYQLLDCKLESGESTSLKLPASCLSIKNPLHNSEIYQSGLKQIKKRLHKRNERLKLYQDVRSAIEKTLLERQANQENVASILNLSVRNLQRRLKEVGSSYQAILDDSRESLALDLLRNSETPLYEIAFIVGFTEPSAFYKAFRRWTGKRPGDYRRDVKAGSRLNSISINEALSVGE